MKDQIHPTQKGSFRTGVTNKKSCPQARDIGNILSPVDTLYLIDD